MNGNIYLDKILKLGNPVLYERSFECERSEEKLIKKIIEDLHQTLLEFRSFYDFGRAIASPQIGYQRRLIYMFVNEPVVFINPVIYDQSNEMIEVWDDCMCFPNLLVKVRRHKICKISFLDQNWEQHSLVFKDDLSELFQHEYDHLDGILATQRAIDDKSLALRT